VAGGVMSRGNSPAR